MIGRTLAIEELPTRKRMAFLEMPTLLMGLEVEPRLGMILELIAA
jgi:hypothetical protein